MRIEMTKPRIIIGSTLNGQREKESEREGESVAFVAVAF